MPRGANRPPRDETPLAAALLLNDERVKIMFAGMAAVADSLLD